MTEKAPKKKRPMKRKASAAKSPAADAATFEDALASLEKTVDQLEGGELSLSDSLKSYEQGIHWLRQCYQQLEQAEQQVALLTKIDDQGEFVAERFDEAEMSLEEKASSRSARRSSRPPTQEGGKDSGGVDGSRGLF